MRPPYLQPCQPDLRQGKHFAVLARNPLAFAALRFVLPRLGAMLVPINFMPQNGMLSVAQLCAGAPAGR